MIRQVRMVELYTDSTGATNIERRVFAFGTHPEATATDAHPVTSAKPVGNKLRIIVDELLVGNSLEEISCRGQVDEDNFSRVPVDSTPDDIAQCSVPKDVLKSSCGGERAVCLCQRAMGCIVGTDTIPMGDPVGVLDANQDGAADDTRFIDGAVGLSCGGAKVPIDLQASFWEPSGNQQIPASGGFDVLGPAIVLVPVNALGTGQDCKLTFSSEVVDKQGNQVCTPPDGDITQSCTPGDVSAFKFTVQALNLTPQGLTDGQTQVTPTDSIFISSNAPLALATVNLTNVTVVVKATQAAVAVTLLPLMNGGTTFGVVPPAGGFPPNTMLTLRLKKTITDTFGFGLPADEVFNFTTGT